MTTNHRIHIFGASGSGTTTLGKAVSQEFRCSHFDADDFFWRPTDPPYREKTPRDERIATISGALSEDDSWVLSGCIASWGDWIKPRLTLAVFVTLEHDARLHRLLLREQQEFGSRIEPDGDLHESHLEFVRWAASYDTAEPPIRSLKLHQQWIAALPCVVIQANSARPVSSLTKQVIEGAAGSGTFHG